MGRAEDYGQARSKCYSGIKAKGLRQALPKQIQLDWQGALIVSGLPVIWYALRNEQPC
jgi:hypothetical protein